MRTLAFAALLAVAAFGDEPPSPESGGGNDDKTVTVRIEAETALADLIDAAAEATGEAILYDPNTQRIRGQAVGVAIEKTVPRDRLLDAYRAILAFYELTLVPIGPSGYEIHLAIDSRSTNNFVKNMARTVPYEELDDWADKAGHYISCAIPVRNIDNLTTLRTAMSTAVTPAGIGRVHEVPGSHAIIVTDFAPTVARIAELVKRMDEQRPATRRVFTVIDLEHGRAPGLAETVTKLLQEPQPQRPRRYARAGDEPRIVAYGPRNAVAISCRQSELPEIRALVAELDKPHPDDRAIEYYRARHVEVARLAILLEAVLAGSDTRVVTDEDRGALIVAAAKRDLPMIRRLLELLDADRKAKQAK